MKPRVMYIAGPQLSPYIAIRVFGGPAARPRWLLQQQSHSAIFRKRDQRGHFESQNQYGGAQFPPRDSERLDGTLQGIFQSTNGS